MRVTVALTELLPSIFLICNRSPNQYLFHEMNIQYFGFYSLAPGILVQRLTNSDEIRLLKENRIWTIRKGTACHDRADKILPKNPWSNDFPPSPDSIQIQLTTACNFSCSFCYAKASNVAAIGEHMSFEKAKKIVDHAYQWGVPQLQWVGGEAFVNKQFTEIVEYTKSLGLVQNIITNAVIPGQNIINHRKTIESFSAIQISVNALNDDFNSLVGRRIFDRFVRAIHAIREYNKNIWLSCVVTPLNANYLDRIVKFGESVGAKGIIFGILAKQGRSADADAPYFSCLRDAQKSLSRVDDKSTIKINCHFDPNLNRPVQESKTEAPFSADREGRSVLFINKDGDIFPFPLLEEEKFKIGNVFNENIDDLWLSSPILSELRRTKNGPELCSTCSYDCAMRSQSMRYLWTGSYSGKIPCFLYNFDA